MPVQIQPVTKERQVQSRRESGSTRGQLFGAGLGALTSLIPGVGPAVALGATGLGATLGGVIGQSVSPGRPEINIQETLAHIPTSKLSNASSILKQGIDSLGEMPQLYTKYSGLLNQAYMQAQMELKRRDR